MFYKTTHYTINHLEWCDMKQILYTRMFFNVTMKFQNWKYPCKVGGQLGTVFLLLFDGKACCINPQNTLNCMKVMLYVCCMLKWRY